MATNDLAGTGHNAVDQALINGFRGVSSLHAIDNMDLRLFQSMLLTSPLL